MMAHLRPYGGPVPGPAAAGGGARPEPAPAGPAPVVALAGSYWVMTLTPSASSYRSATLNTLRLAPS